jgi:hypothetical protein
LSSDLLVQLGAVTEQLNRHWYAKNTGQVATDAQRQVFHPVHRRWRQPWVEACGEVVVSSGLPPSVGYTR